MLTVCQNGKKFPGNGLICKLLPRIGLFLNHSNDSTPSSLDILLNVVRRETVHYRQEISKTKEPWRNNLCKKCRTDL